MSYQHCPPHVARGVARVGRVGAGQVGEHRHAGRDVVTAEQPRVRRADVALVDVHPGGAVGAARDRDRGPGLDHRRVQRRLDLGPRGARIGRTPDAASVRGRRRWCSGLFGSKAMSRTPRGEQTPPLLNSAVLPVQLGHVDRSVVDEASTWRRRRSTCTGPTSRRPAPAGSRRCSRTSSCREARSWCATYMVSGSPGSIRISPMPLPATGASPIGPVQVAPPSVDL